MDFRVFFQYIMGPIQRLLIVNWKATPLIDVDTVISLISNTTTTKGLTVICEEDDNIYPRGIKVTGDEFHEIKFVKIPPFGSWDYKLIPDK